MSTAPSVRKALSGLLRDPKNNTCADCKAQSHPRWASWSLGVFVCIKCAGIHRSLGTHISKVKSVDLDIWKEEHLQKLVKMKNNEIANSYYECKLPESMKKPITDGNRLQNFIRSKYEAKKWIGDEEPSVDGNISSVSSTLSSVATDSSNESLLVENEPLAKSDSNSSSNVMSSTHSSLLNLQISSVPKRSEDKSRRNDVSGRPDLKKSILSLYSKPTSSRTQNSFFTKSNSTASTISLSSTQPSNNNSNDKSNNLSVNSLDDNDLFKNVWST